MARGLDLDLVPVVHPDGGTGLMVVLQIGQPAPASLVVDAAGPSPVGGVDLDPGYVSVMTQANLREPEPTQRLLATLDLAQPLRRHLGAVGET